MWHKAIYALLLAALLAFALLLLPGEEARAQRHAEADPVEVINFPDPQRVAGEVEVGTPIPAAKLVSLPETIAVPAARNEPGQWVAAGVVDTDGWSRVTLSLTGEVRGRGGNGRVGALLVPDVQTVQDALDQGRLLFPLSVEAAIEPSSPWVESEQPVLDVAFPRYRVYLYNTSERSVAVRLFAYLTQ